MAQGGDNEGLLNSSGQLAISVKRGLIPSCSLASSNQNSSLRASLLERILGEQPVPSLVPSGDIMKCQGWSLESQNCNQGTKHRILKVGWAANAMGSQDKGCKFYSTSDKLIRSGRFYERFLLPWAVVKLEESLFAQQGSLHANIIQCRCYWAKLPWIVFQGSN